MGFTTAEVGDLVVEGRPRERRSLPYASSSTTRRLRDGAQQADLSYTVEDRLRILHKLDQIGFPYIEGGWPGANPRDTEFFELATKETLQHAELTAFGMTRRAGRAGRGLRRRCATSWTPAPRSSAWSARPGTCTSPRRCAPISPRASRWCATPSRSCVRQGRRVFFDAEHFFDGYRSDPAFAMQVLAAAEEAGAERLVLCDTNGGMLPFDIAEVVRSVRCPGLGARSGSTCTTMPGARSRTRWSPSTPACSRCRAR